MDERKPLKGGDFGGWGTGTPTMKLRSGGCGGGAGRGLHSSISQLNVSVFEGMLWVLSVDWWVITRHKLDTKRVTNQNGSCRAGKWTGVSPWAEADAAVPGSARRCYPASLTPSSRRPAPRPAR